MGKKAYTTVSTVNMSHNEWLDYRRTGIGGSDAAVITEASAFKSPYELWQDKLGLTDTDISDNLPCRTGTFLEPLIAKLFEERTGLATRNMNQTLRNSEYPFMIANIDRRIEGGSEGLECKTTTAFNKNKFLEDDPSEYTVERYPLSYYVQMQHYMAVTGWQKWYLAVLIGNFRFEVYEVHRNEDAIKALIQDESEFWELVQTKTNIWEE